MLKRMSEALWREKSAAPLHQRDEKKISIPQVWQQPQARFVFLQLIVVLRLNAYNNLVTIRIGSKLYGALGKAPARAFDKTTMQGALSALLSSSRAAAEPRVQFLRREREVGG